MKKFFKRSRTERATTSQNTDEGSNECHFFFSLFFSSAWACPTRRHFFCLFLPLFFLRLGLPDASSLSLFKFHFLSCPQVRMSVRSFFYGGGERERRGGPRTVSRQFFFFFFFLLSFPPFLSKVSEILRADIQSPTPNALVVTVFLPFCSNASSSLFSTLGGGAQVQVHGETAGGGGIT